jgi:predicted ATPase
LFSVLNGFWSVSHMAFNGDALRELAGQFLAFADKQKATPPLMIGHRLMGCSLLGTGDIAEGRAHLDRALALYDPEQHRPLATRFSQDVGVVILCWRSRAQWLLGYPEAALADVDRAIKCAREIGEAATLMNALAVATSPHVWCGNYVVAKARNDEFLALANEKGASFYKAYGMLSQGWLLALTGNFSQAVQLSTSGITALRSTGTTFALPSYLSSLARAYAELGQLDRAWGCIDEAISMIETTKETWHEAEVHRSAGEIALMPPEPDAPKAEAYFQRALEVARRQQAKSWELRAAMSLARLWRSQGNSQQARELIAPLYGWFTEGFDTLDLREAKALLELRA